jgi:hypothetical protein
MVVAAPVGHPARLLPYIAIGAALGVAVREGLATVWHTPTQRWVFMLVFAAVAALPLGWMVVNAARPRLLAAVWGWSGALASISATSIVALAVSPLWALAGIALIPLSAATGVAVGAIAGLKHRQRHLVTETP